MIKNWIFNITRKISLYPVAYNNMFLIKKGLLEIGKGTYGQPIIDQYRGSETKVTIGNYTSIAPGVRFITGGIHPIDTVSQYPFRSQFNLEGKYKDGNPGSKGEIKVGSDVWIATNVTILSGVSIGNGAIIATNSLVTQNVPDYAIVMGVPAKVKGYRFSETHIKELLKIKWWDWEEEVLQININQLTSKDIDNFITKNRVK